MANTAASVLITRAVDNVSRLSTATARSGATLSNKSIDYLNDTMVRMARKHDFREMDKRYTAATIADQKTYTLPTSYKDVLTIVLRDGNNSRKLTYVSPRLFNMRIPYPENETTGLPTWYIQYGDEFDLFKIPDAAYTMYMRTLQWPTKITATTDLIDYKTDKDELIVAGMTAKLFDHLQMYEDGALWEAKFIAQRDEAILVDEHLPDYDPVGIGFTADVSTLPGDYWNRIDVMRSD